MIQTSPHLPALRHPAPLASTKKCSWRARRTARREARRQGSEVRPATLAFARYVIVFTTFCEEAFSAREVLEWYRLRWQIELVFKRLKSLAQLGHLPKRDNESARAWLYV